jgi:hypothetical protein
MNSWTIYFNPSDYPWKYVVRKFDLGGAGEARPTADMFVADSLDEARALLPLGLSCFERATDDDAVIVETWI